MVCRQLLFRKPREVRVGPADCWIETKANADTRSTYERGPYLIGYWTRLADARDFCPACCSSRVQYKIFFFLTAHYFTSGSPVSWYVSLRKNKKFLKSIKIFYIQTKDFIMIFSPRILALETKFWQVFTSTQNLLLILIRTIRYEKE